MTRQTIQNWELLEILSESGGNGIIWKAKNRNTEKFAAIKILRTFENPDKEIKRQKRFQNEILALKYIQDRQIPRIMPIIEHGFTQDGTPWYAMPVGQKIDFFNHSTKDIIYAMMQVSETIASLHEIGMVHRDIKPSNLIMLNNEITLSDFGLARIMGDEHFTVTGEQMGSFGYTASECVGKSDSPRFKCDVYALSKTVWVLLKKADSPPHGELRSPDDDLASMGDGIDDSSEVRLSYLQELLFAATDRDPNNRPTIRQFYDGLKTSLIEESPSVKQKTRSPADRARTLFADDAARNKRDTETNQVYEELCHKFKHHWKATWKNVIENLGWNSGSLSGGNMGPHTLGLSEGWLATNRHFFQGNIRDKRYEIVLTIRRKQIPGTLRLLLGITIAIQKIEVNRYRKTSFANDEWIITSRDFDTFIKGPQLVEVEMSACAFIENKEVQFRTIEKLRELTKGTQ